MGGVDSELMSFRIRTQYLCDGLIEKKQIAVLFALNGNYLNEEHIQMVFHNPNSLKHMECSLY